MGVEVDGGIAVRPQDGRRGKGANRPIKTRLHRSCLSRVGDDAQDLLCFQDLADAHGNGAMGNVCEGREPSFPKLLAAASIVKLNDNIWLLRFEIRWWIVESEMTVLPDSDESQIDRRRQKRLTHRANSIAWVFFTVQEKIFRDTSFFD